MTSVLERLQGAGRVVAGEFRPGGTGQEWCDAEVLRAVRRRSLAVLRQEIEPVEPAALARFAPAWQGISGRSAARGVDGVLRAVEQLAGVPVPASALETLILPARVADYAPAMLDELTGAGEVLWCGAGSLGGSDGWLCLAPADAADLLLPPPAPLEASDLHDAVLQALGAGGDAVGALFFRALSDRVGSTDDAALAAAVWDLVWSGQVTNDTLAPVRALRSRGGPSGGGRSGPRGGAAAPRARPGRARYGRALGGGRPVLPARGGPPSMSGRWWLLPPRDGDPTLRAHAAAEALLDRYGVVTRGAVAAQRLPGGFAAVYPVLKAAEESGRARRGYFVEGLGAAQFATPGAVDRVRAYAAADRAPTPALVLAAADPANVYGAALPWPVHGREANGASSGADAQQAGPDLDSPGLEQAPLRKAARGHQPARKAGSLVVLVDGELVLYVERGGKTLLSFSDDPAVLGPAADALALSARGGALGKLQVERADGAPVVSSALGEALEASGFRPTPRGLQLRS